MARKTKEEAAATRDRILDAAEQLFSEQGVSRTTLQHIATAAGVTRGAIYWHFDDKSALFNAMMERAILPLERARALLDHVTDDTDPLLQLRDFMLEALGVAVSDPQARRVFEIATLKIEFVEEMDAVRQRRKQNLEAWMVRSEACVRAGIERGLVRTDADPRVAAIAMWVLVDGLIRNWLFDTTSFDLMVVGTEVIDAHLDCLRVRSNG